MANKFCTYHDSEKHGQTSVMCCNKCGLPDEEFWHNPSLQTNEKYWRERCEAAEMVIKWFPRNELEVMWNAMAEFERWQELKSTIIPILTPCVGYDIDFLVWYSGMDEQKIKNAYERYKREIEQGKP